MSATSRPVLDPVFDPVSAVAAWFQGFDRPWAIGGGWAIDLFLGHATRAHGDVDVAVFRIDQHAAHAHLAARGFALAYVRGGALHPWAFAERLELPVHEIHGVRDRPPGSLELLLNERTETEWVYRRDATVRLAVDRALQASSAGIPVLAPEVVLLYKAKHAGEERHATDFRSALPALGETRRSWLREALGRAHPGHPWLVRLG